VLEVLGRDRPGLLYDIARELADAKLSIRSAHVGAYGERVHDVFYVEKLGGGLMPTDMDETLTTRLGRNPSPPTHRTRHAFRPHYAGARAGFFQPLGGPFDMSPARNVFVQTFFTLGSRVLGFARDLALNSRSGGQGPLMDLLGDGPDAAQPVPPSSCRRCVLARVCACIRCGTRDRGR